MRAGLQAPRKLTLHSLRHGFASLLIANGLNVVYVSRQLGHANPAITLSVYSHQFDQAQHAERTSALLEASFGALVDGTSLETTIGEQRRIEALPAASEGG